MFGMYDKCVVVAVSDCTNHVSINIAHREDTGNPVSNASDKMVDGSWAG
jgi:hypothetical protein